MGIVELVLGTLIGNYFGTGTVCSGIGIGSGVTMTGGARGIVRCRSLSIDPTTLVVISPYFKKGVGF